MVASWRSVVAGALLVAAGATTASADYYGGPAALEPVVMQPASWYVRGDGSYSWMHAGELDGAVSQFGSVSIDNTWALGGGVGTYFGRSVRGDITYEWRGSTDVHGGGPFTTDFDINSSLLLVNLYYDFRPFERFTPYIGIGVGAAYHRVSSGTIQTACNLCGTYEGDSTWSAAGALMAGFSFRIDHGHAVASIKDQPVVEPGRLHLDVGYRFLYLGDAHAGGLVGTTFPTPGPRIEDMTAHEIRVGLRWDIR